MRCIHTHSAVWRLTVTVALLTGWGILRSVAGQTPKDPQVSDLSLNEEIVFFPVAARQVDDAGQWEAQVHAWVFEPSEDSLRRRALVELLNRTIANPQDAAERARFASRIRPFLVDNERAKQVVVRTGDRLWALSRSDPDGHAWGTIRWPGDVVAKSGAREILEVEAVLPTGDTRRFRGQVQFLPPEGTTVISDIDDTIKDSQVLNREELLRNTFLRPFRPVSGMPELYRRWHTEQGACFQWVSASPWQLYVPLEELRREAGFPPTVFHLRRFRWKDASSLASLFDSQDDKRKAIESILQTWPGHSFVLVGDTGEKDPEVYGEIARRHPARIRKIYLRDVTAEPRDADRYVQALRDVPAELWELFTDPARLEWPR
ncbi:MAG: App1 family protein [Pirellulales bacterium]